MFSKKGYKLKGIGDVLREVLAFIPSTLLRLDFCWDPSKRVMI